MAASCTSVTSVSLQNTPAYSTKGSTATFCSFGSVVLSQHSGSQEQGDKDFHTTEDFTTIREYRERRNTRNELYT